MMLIKNWSDAERCTHEDFNRIEENTDYIANETDTDIEVKIDWDYSSYPFADELNRIEQNIEGIRKNASLPISFGYLHPKNWVALIPITFRDLNRIENNIQAVDTMNRLIPPSFKYCGTFTCGEADLV